MKNTQKDVLGVYESIADRWNERHYKSRSWMRFFRPLLKKTDVVLDAGCGNAINAISLAPFCKKIYAIDFSPKMVVYAKRNVRKSEFSKKIAASKGDVLKLPFKDSFFNAVAYFAVIHHLFGKKDWDLAFSEMNRVLKKGGLVFITVWNAETGKQTLENAVRTQFIDFESKTGKKMARLYYFFTKKQLFELARKNGFTVKESFYERRGNKTSVDEGRNFCMVLQKK